MDLKSYKKRNHKLSVILCFILCIIFLGELFYLFYNTGIVEGFNQRADKLKAYVIASRDDQTILPGDFFDRNGNILTKAAWKTIGQGKENEKAGSRKVDITYTDGKAYAQLLGYTGNRTLNLSAESAKDVVGQRGGYRLMNFLDDETYWRENGLYSTVGKDGGKGQDVTLTLDHKIQLKVYEILAKEMNTDTEKGSAVVLDVATGEILSMVAFPTYDFNNRSKAIAQMEWADKNMKYLEPGYPVSYKGATAPGSIFKVLLAAALLEHGMEEFSVLDKTFTIDGWNCKNAYGSPGDSVDYYKGLERSSNVFYGQAALALGKDKIRETAEKFMLYEDQNKKDGKDDTYLKLDFGNVQYNWDLEVTEKEIAQTGFGQGKTELTTIYAAMITQAIANDGTMMKPYLIQSLIDANGKVVYKGKPEVLSEAVSKSTADKVSEAMAAAVKYTTKHHKGMENTAQILEKYQVAGKTGTAQTGQEIGPTNAWFISFAPVDNPKYVVVVNQCRTNKGGYQMMDVASSIYQYLFEEK